MTRYSIKVGEIIVIKGQRFEIVNLVGRKTQARAVETGELQDWLTTDLLRLYEKGQLQFTDLLSQTAEPGPDQPQGALGRTLQDFPERVRAKALRKWKYLKAICPDGPIRLSRTALQTTLKSLAPEIEGDLLADPPSLRTFYRWHRSWVNAQMDVRSLIERWDLRGRKPHMDYPQRLAGIITEGIEKFYLTDQRQSKKDLLGWIHHETNMVNRTLPPDEALPKINTRTVGKFLGQYDRYHVLKARYGERYARQSVRTFGGGAKTERPLQRVEMDHTPLDIQVIDESTQLVLGRPWITLMIDHYSRMIVGMHISFRGPSVDSVLRCLRHAIAPKSYVAERFPEIEGEWPCYGLIEELWCDNGLEFHGKAIEAAAQELGIHVMYCPSREPHHKGTIERFNRTLNHAVLHRLPGTTFSRYDKRLQYNSDDQAVIPLSALEEIIHRWLIDVYSCEFHRGIQAAPLQKWAEGIAHAPPKLPPDLNSLKVYVARTERRHLNKNGIQANQLRYNSDALQDMRHRYGDIEVTVRIDPDDVDVVYVLDEQRKSYVMAQCILPGYAEGMSVEMHRLIRKKARLDYDKSPLAAGLLSAKAEILETTAAIQVKHKKPGKAISKKPSKLSREAREILQTRPRSVTTEPPAEAKEGLSMDHFLSDDWLTDVPDLLVESRPFEQPTLNIYEEL